MTEQEIEEIEESMGMPVKAVVNTLSGDKLIWHIDIENLTETQKAFVNAFLAVSKTQVGEEIYETYKDSYLLDAYACLDSIVDMCDSFYNKITN